MDRRVLSTLSVTLCHASLLVVSEYKAHTVHTITQCMIIKESARTYPDPHQCLYQSSYWEHTEWSLFYSVCEIQNIPPSFRTPMLLPISVNVPFHLCLNHLSSAQNVYRGKGSTTSQTTVNVNMTAWRLHKSATQSIKTHIHHPHLSMLLSSEMNSLKRPKSDCLQLQLHKWPTWTGWGEHRHWHKLIPCPQWVHSVQHVPSRAKWAASAKSRVWPSTGGSMNHQEGLKWINMAALEPLFPARRNWHLWVACN